MNFVGVNPGASSAGCGGSSREAVAGGTACVALRAGEARAWDGAAGDRIEGIAGDVWVTQAGDDRDMLLAAGRMCVLRGTGKVVAQGLTDARVKVRKPMARSWWERVASWGRLAAPGRVVR